MLVYLLKRILAFIPTILVLSLLSFTLMHVAPGGPFTGERVLLPEIKKNIEKQYHLDEPVWKQYVRYLNNTLHGDLGPSYKTRDWTVNQIIAKGFPVSFKLGMLAMLLAILVGVLLGTLAALNQNSWLDSLCTGFAMFGISVPNFVVAPILVFIFGLTLHWLPVASWGGGKWNYLILPVISLALPQIAIIARMMRGSLIEVLSSNYIRTARAKGLPQYLIIWRHALRPAFMPVLSYLGPGFANIVTGSVVIESIYALPGIGTFLVQGALSRDYTTVMGIVLLTCILMLFFNLIVDLLYRFLDPQVSFTGRLGKSH